MPSFRVDCVCASLQGGAELFAGTSQGQEGALLCQDPVNVYLLGKNEVQFENGCRQGKGPSAFLSFQWEAHPHSGPANAT